jgi:hypothetical protein
MTHHGGFLHSGHEDSVLQVIRSLTNFHATLPDRPSQEKFGLIITRHQLDEKNEGEVCALPSLCHR